MNPQFFKLYQGDHENTAWWDLRHCVIFSGGIFFSWLCLNGRSQPSSCQCTPAFLTCAKGCVAATHLVWLLGIQSSVYFQGGQRGGGDVQCVGLCDRGDGCRTCLPRVWEQDPAAGRVLFTSRQPCVRQTQSSFNAIIRFCWCAL